MKYDDIAITSTVFFPENLIAGNPSNSKEQIVEQN